MWQRFFGPCCPYRRWLSIALVVLGVVLLAIFVPPRFWLALIGASLVVIGIVLCRG